MVFFLLVLMGVGERPEKHLVSMSLPHSRNDLVGSLPTLCPPLHALSKWIDPMTLTTAIRAAVCTVVDARRTVPL